MLFSFFNKNKKAQGLSLNLVVVAIIALMVMIIIIFIFARKMGDADAKTSSCSALGGTAQDNTCPAGTIGIDSSDSKFCCLRIGSTCGPKDNGGNGGSCMSLSDCDSTYKKISGYCENDGDICCIKK
jgi:hypothetical protein